LPPLAPRMIWRIRSMAGFTFPDALVFNTRTVRILSNVIPGRSRPF
jgi:hypothetical protein